ncbi:MAG: [protein-PII] uridylyltransferase [Candidatus Sulfobium sp.]|jgi:[protein-PII] uridylyltransferase
MKEEILRDIEGWVREGLTGGLLVERYTRTIDTLLRDIFGPVESGEDTALLAVGGYGRGELAPFSDIDIMFLASRRECTEKAEAVLYGLWDTGLDISHSFRTAAECIEEAFRDVRTRTSLLESRYIAGDRRLYSDFREKVYPVIAYKKRKDFVRDKLREMEKRHLDSGESPYLLEPHLKEGEGGLRDIHTAYWLSKVAMKVADFQGFLCLLDSYESRRLAGARDFLLRARYCLHLESGRKNDVLSFEYQKNVAILLGFHDSHKFMAYERLLRYYYLKSKIIRELTKKIMVMCSRPYVRARRDFLVRKVSGAFAVSGGRLISTKGGPSGLDAAEIMEGFYLRAKTGRTFSDALKEKIRTSLVRINRATRSSPELVRRFLDILRGERVYDTLAEMNETGVLGRFLPEFGALRLLVVREPYHMYTVDEHTLMAVRHLEELRNTKYGRLGDLRLMINGMENVDILFMVLLFHDIGKGAGRHHEEEGYKRLKNVMERFNLDGEKRARIELLVRNHVLMARVALTREASDTGVIAAFADEVGDSENLRALYLITYADMSAVNPGFWDSWKAYLLRELYDNTLEYLTGVKEDRSEYIERLNRTYPGIEAGALASFVEDLPDRYLLSTPGDRIIADYALVRKASETGFALRIDAGTDSVAELSVSARDCPGLFSKIVGLLSSKGVNIVRGRIFTASSGIVIDKISASNWKKLWWDGFENEVEEGLRAAIVGGRPLSVTSRSATAVCPFDVFIELDNEASEEFTLLEIFSPDRLGLLYDISSVMYKIGIDIVSARINTETGLAQDIFYVQSEKRKIGLRAAQELLADLWEVLKK